MQSTSGLRDHRFPTIILTDVKIVNTAYEAKARQWWSSGPTRRRFNSRVIYSILYNIRFMGWSMRAIALLLAVAVVLGPSR
jgi:hypothetical protein